MVGTTVPYGMYHHHVHTQMSLFCGKRRFVQSQPTTTTIESQFFFLEEAWRLQGMLHKEADEAKTKVTTTTL